MQGPDSQRKKMMVKEKILRTSTVMYKHLNMLHLTSFLASSTGFKPITFMLRASIISLFHQTQNICDPNAQGLDRQRPKMVKEKILRTSTVIYKHLNTLHLTPLW